MKHILIILSLIFGAAVCHAQDIQEYSDSSSLVLPSLTELMPQNVQIEQSSAIQNAFLNYRSGNINKLYNGFRIRIYYGSGQNARTASQESLNRFNLMYPEIAAYREYENPYFRVTVGDYRTKIDAERVLNQIGNDFSGAIVIRQKMRFPSL